MKTEQLFDYCDQLVKCDALYVTVNPEAERKANVEVHVPNRDLFIEMSLVANERIWESNELMHLYVRGVHFYHIGGNND